MNSPKVVAVVLAHNEQRALPKTLNILRAFRGKGLVQEIIVINDGSTDDTAYVAQRGGAKVITQENKGKRGGFITGAFAARSAGAKVMVLLDADIIRLPEKTLREMINVVTTGRYIMATAQQYEQNQKFGHLNVKKKRFGRVGLDSSNAQRAFNISGLGPLFRGNKKWLQYLTSNGDIANYPKAKNWGLEAALEKIIGRDKKIWLREPPQEINQGPPISLKKGYKGASPERPIFTRTAFRVVGGTKAEVRSIRDNMAAQQGGGRAIIECIEYKRRFLAKGLKGARKKARLKR